MQCTWKSGVDCLKLFKAIQHTNRMVNIQFDERGLHIMTMDTSKTSLVRLELEPCEFKEFRCPTPVTIGIYTDVLVNILNKAKKHEVMWSVTHDTELCILFKVDDQTTQWTVRTIDIDEDQLDIPELEDDMALCVPRDVLRQWLDMVLMGKADVGFKVTDQNIVCESKSIEMGTICHTEPVKTDRVRVLAARKPVDILLSFNSAKSIDVYAAMGGESCFLGLSGEQPTRIKVSLGDDSYLCLYVAPKITE